MILISMKIILILSFMSDLQLGVIDLNNAEHRKKDISKELKPAAWHPTRWWDWCFPEDEKKEIKPIFIE